MLEFPAAKHGKVERSRGRRPSIDQTPPSPVHHMQLFSRHKPPILSSKVTQAQGTASQIKNKKKSCCRGAQMRRLVYMPQRRACLKESGSGHKDSSGSPPSLPILPTISESFNLTHDIRMLARLLRFCFRAHLGCGAEGPSAPFVVASLITGRALPLSLAYLGSHVWGETECVRHACVKFLCERSPLANPQYPEHPCCY